MSAQVANPSQDVIKSDNEVQTNDQNGDPEYKSGVDRRRLRHITAPADYDVGDRVTMLITEGGRTFEAELTVASVVLSSHNEYYYKLRRRGREYFEGRNNMFHQDDLNPA